MRAVLLVVLLAAASAGDLEPVRLLYPANRTAHAGPVRLMAATAKDAPAPPATLDGQPLALQRLEFAPTWQLPGKLKETAARVGERSTAALWVATLELKPGAHTVLVGGHKLALWREGDVARPADYALAHSHAPVGQEAPKLDCAGCHEQPDGALETARTPHSCADCHDEDSVQLIHQHVSPPLARCASCHDPHGSARPKLLVDSKEALCSRCHEKGHSKP